MKLRLKSRLQACITLVCTLTLVFAVIPVQATEISDLENSTSDLQNQLSSINSELLTISQEISGIQMQVEITAGKVQKTKDELAVTQENEAKQYEDMKARIKYMYEIGNASLLEMLFSAENMTDFLNKADFIQNISEYDRQMLTEIQQTRDQIKEEEATLEAQQESLLSLQAEMDSRQAALQLKAAETSTDLNALQAQLQQAKAEEAARLAQEAAEAAAAAAAATASNSGNSGGTVIDGSGSGTSTGPSIPVDAGELDIFAAILDCEARYDYNSMLAVATVIMNRVHSSVFPNSISGVVYASGQFEPVWSGKLDAKLAAGPSSLAYQVATDAMNGARLASVSDCYYFLYAGATNKPGVNVGGNLFFQSW